MAARRSAKTEHPPEPLPVAATPPAVALPPPWPPSDAQRRVEQIVRWIAEGRTNAEVFDLAAERWGADVAPALCEQGVGELIRAGEAGRAFAIGFALSAAGEIYRQAMAIGYDSSLSGEPPPRDLEVALKAVKLIAALGERLD